MSIRQSEYTKVFGAYLDVAKHFQSQHDYKTVRIQPQISVSHCFDTIPNMQGVFFLGKAVDVARRGGDISREAEATSLLGGSLIFQASRSRKKLAIPGQLCFRACGQCNEHVAGLANERMGNLEAAMEYHEKHRELLRLSGDTSLRYLALA